MTSAWMTYGPSAPAPAPAPSGSDSRSKRVNPRQLLSCTKCRERKVKCDRTKPCSACCARGHPKECEFIVGEGNDYSAIQQSYELRKLRTENQQLKQKLHAAQLLHSDDEDEDDRSSDRKGSASTSKASAARQRRFKTGSRIDNLYFGTPGLANIVSDFANLQLGGQSLTHTLPKGKDLYAAEPTTYPFGVVPNYSDTTSLLNLLPEREELFGCLELFQRRAQSCSFPHTPHEVTKREIERFLSDRNNAIQFPDMLALLFATLATGLQMGQYDRSGGQWVEGAVEATRTRSDAFIAASMQALRDASFMNRPTLLGIQTVVMMGPYLTNSGRFLDAWTLFGTTIRLAHSIGLHRDPRLLDPTPPLRECTERRVLWWWMLHMDQQYSVTLGRPLGISGIGDCPPPQQLTTNPTMLRLGEFIDQFTILARQILSSNEMMSVNTVDGYTDKLIALWDTMPAALQFTENWIQQSTPLPEWPLEVMSATLFAKMQSFLILLNRQRVERTQSSQSEGSPPLPSRSGWVIASGSTFPEHNTDRAAHRGRSLVIHSSVALLQAFMFFYHRNKAVLICWTMCQQAFNACMILVLDAWETGDAVNEFWINQAFGVFHELNNKGVHKLAELAVQRISHGLIMLEHRRSVRAQSAATSRRPSVVQQNPQQPSLQLDTASMTDFAGDTVMGNTGMFLLEDPGLQFYTSQTSTFSPLEWIMPGSAHPSYPSNPPTPTIPSPTIPVSQITAAPFPSMPVMSPPTIPVTNSPFAFGLQPRMPSSNRRMASSRPRHHPQEAGQSAFAQTGFTPINTADQSEQAALVRRFRPANEQHAPEVPTMASGLPQGYAPSGYTPQSSSKAPSSQQQSFSQHRGSRQSHATSSTASNHNSTGAGPRGSHQLDKPPRSHQRRK